MSTNKNKTEAEANQSTETVERKTYSQAKVSIPGGQAIVNVCSNGKQYLKLVKGDNGVYVAVEKGKITIYPNKANAKNDEVGLVLLTQGVWSEDIFGSSNKALVDRLDD